LDRSADQVIARLTGGGDGPVIAGSPLAVFFIGHVLQLLADAAVAKFIADPLMTVADKTPDRLLDARFDTGDHQPGQQPLGQSEGDDRGIETAE